MIQVPINLKVAGGSGTTPSKQPADDPAVDPTTEAPRLFDGMEHRKAAALVAADARRRMAKRIGAQVRRASKDSAKFVEFLAALHRDNDAVVREAFGPAAAVASLADGRAADLHVSLLAGSLFDDVRSACDRTYSTAKPAEFVSRIDAVMSALEA